jgi:hypothetical protein
LRILAFFSACIQSIYNNQVQDKIK